MKDKVFIDTNIWVYNYAYGSKTSLAKASIDAHFDQVVISTQVLNELFNVLTTKLKVKSKEEAREIVKYLSAYFSVQTISTETILLAIDLSIK